MRAILTAVLVLTSLSLFAQSPSSSYYTRVLRAYELDDLSHTTEWYISSNVNLVDEYNFLTVGWNIDVFNLNLYRGLNRSILDAFRGLSLRGTLGFNAMLDYRSKRVVKTENYLLRATDAYSGFYPNGQLQLIIRYLHPINFKISRGVGYHMQFHNYTLRRKYLEWDLSGDPGYEATDGKLKANSRQWNLQFMDRYAVFFPMRGGTRYLELGAFSNTYYDKPFWQFYLSFGYSIR